jgi:enoyl-[acyl-carrier protein] reductase I
MRRFVDIAEIAEIGRVCAFLIGGSTSRMTGEPIYVDDGLHNLA